MAIRTMATTPRTIKEEWVMVTKATNTGKDQGQDFSAGVGAISMTDQSLTGALRIAHKEELQT
ncbi:hypothetical protein PTT_09881 [Pyrenophora teres f. teres 0-1]|uniref:Uncharacterized protein n=1 Tax=Pyrenophora teres f. teres (strain 0-1) TaxID=861557 RepID=E3RMY1_PYRTT|nr:hypothetical protein PTT_09881 [Pyrenophora teres f. teres 0-1]